MATVEGSVSLQMRFQGCLCGVLLGDCLGAEFEEVWCAKPVKNVIKYMEQMKKRGKKDLVLYTDDTCMTLDLGESLVKLKKFDPLDVSKSFCDTYFTSKVKRGYGANVTSVFRQLYENEYKDPWTSARDQFGGSGSYGNGSAMRVAPVPLFHDGDKKRIIELAGNQSKLTHTHPLGVNGAIIQALAIDKVMWGEKISDPIKFCEEILDELKENTEKEIGIYEKKFKEIIRLLGLDREVKASDIEDAIGTDVTAHEAVPAALFCFLYTLEKTNVEKLKSYSGFVRAVVFSVAVSCDCDTVGSMVGAIAGAYYGYEEIPNKLLKSCEGFDRILKLANDLYDLNRENSKEEK